MNVLGSGGVGGVGEWVRGFEFVLYQSCWNWGSVGFGLRLCGWCWGGVGV